MREFILATLARVKETRSESAPNYQFFLPGLFLLCAFAEICGYHGYREHERFGRDNPDIVTRDLGLPRPPSKSTLQRFWSSLNFDFLFQALLEIQLKLCGNISNPLLLNIDGKYVRGGGKIYPNMVNIYSDELKISLAVYPVSKKENEKTCAITLLGQIFNKFAVMCTITGDAMYTTTNIIRFIHTNKKHYLFTLKKNQQIAYDEANEWYQKEGHTLSHQKTVECRHGRIEERSLLAICAENVFTSETLETFPGIRSVIFRNLKIENKKTGKVEENLRIYITSHDQISAQTIHGINLEDIPRQHWKVETMHGRLDRLPFADDASLIRDSDTAANFSIFRRFLLFFFQYRPSDDSTIGEFAQALRRAPARMALLFLFLEPGIKLSRQQIIAGSM